MEVSICCETYNHEKYIENAIESFINQKTKFQYEILIHDDASQDKTTEILKKFEKKYPDKIKVIYQKENQYSKGNRRIFLTELLSKARGKYIALCEGDDYWIDELKLQKQYDLMENMQDITCCVHRTIIVDEKGNATENTIPRGEVQQGRIEGKEFIRKTIINDNHYFHTSSYFFRKNLCLDLMEKLPKFLYISPVGDRAMLFYLALKGDLYYLQEAMSAYRIFSIGSWSSSISNSKEKMNIKNIEMVRMMEAFDEYSKNIFHKEIFEYVTKYNFQIFQFQLLGGKMLEKRYRRLFKDLSFPKKVYFILCALCPTLGKTYRRMKEIHTRRNKI